MKKKIIKSLIMAIIMSVQCATIFATTGADNLQNFLNGYVAKAGILVCVAGSIEICASFASSSADKKFRGLKMFVIGLVLVSINNIINTILK